MLKLKTLDDIFALRLCQWQLSIDGTESILTFYSVGSFSCYSNDRLSLFLPFAIQVKPPPSVTPRNKQPWHPDEDDEEFTANEDEGQTCSQSCCFLSLESSEPDVSGFFTSSTWTV